MSDNNNQESSTPERQEANRVFAAELDAATIEFEKKSDRTDENEGGQSRAPNYNLLPTGVGVNRVAMMGSCTEITQKNDDPVTMEAKLLDQTGETYLYAGKYNQEAVNTLQSIETPAHMLVIGKPNSYTSDNDDTTYVTLEPETVKVVDADVRDRWVAETVLHTLSRLDGARDGTNDHIEEALQMYDYDFDELREDVESIARDILADHNKPVQTQATA
jgi:RPA family protein